MTFLISGEMMTMLCRREKTTRARRRQIEGAEEGRRRGGRGAAEGRLEAWHNEEGKS